MNILSVYDKLESLVGRLPESLQNPILREVRPLKALFLQQRSPRILLLGDRAASRSTVINSLCGVQAAETTEDYLQDSAWQVFATGRGQVRVLDARRPASLASFRRSLQAETPDICLFLHTEPRREEDRAADLEQASSILKELAALSPASEPVILGLTVGSTGSSAEGALRTLEMALHDSGRFAFTSRVRAVLSTVDGQRLARAVATELPETARLELVRAAGLRDLQAEMAHSVVKSVSAICGAVGTQPIPLADFPILTALQASMVAGIMYISGRELSTKMAGEWIGALGANLGAALVLREGARAVLKLVPIWGDLVAGGIAAAGTYGIGKAATAYFIEGASLGKARKLARER